MIKISDFGISKRVEDSKRVLRLTTGVVYANYYVRLAIERQSTQAVIARLRVLDGTRLAICIRLKIV